MKYCKKCSSFKEEKEFSKNKKSKDGLQTSCKECMAKILQSWYQKNKEKHAAYSKQWQTDNKEHTRQYREQYYLENKERMNRKMHDWYRKNSEKAKEKSHQWQKNNKSRIRENTRAYSLKRRKEDVEYRLRKVLRARLYSALHNNQKMGSAIKDLGCTISELKQYLESQFQPGMTWDNWSKDGWHIDHIFPLSKTDLSDPEQLKKVCHYTNLQPMWASENLSKNNRILELS